MYNSPVLFCFYREALSFLFPEFRPPLAHCYGLNAGSPPKSYVNISAHHVMVGKWGLWEVIRSRGWSPHEYDECPHKRRPECFLSLFLALCHVRTHLEVSWLQTKKSALTIILDLLSPWSRTSQSVELWEINSCCLSCLSMVFC